MSTPAAALVLVGIVIALYLSYKGFRKYPTLVKYVPFINWVLETVKNSLAFWSFKNEYSSVLVFLQKSTLLAETLAMEGTDLRNAREKVRLLVNDLHSSIHPGHKANKIDVDSAVAAYMLLISNDVLFKLVNDIRDNHKEVDVVNATYLAIDVAGEIVSLKDKFGRDYFQHLIYGINQSLILIRDKGTDPKTLKKVAAILYRTYKITKAYRHSRGLKNLTEVELYEKIIRLFVGIRSIQSG